MLFDFHQIPPGYLFVAATLVPLASFVLLLLGSAAWGLARTYRDTDYGALFYNLFGGDKPGPTKAYIALGAIVIAFLFSATGFVIFAVEHYTYYETKQRVERQNRELEEAEKQGNEAKADEIKNNFKADVDRVAADEARLNPRWSAQWDWLRVSPTGIADERNGTNLQVGFRIDTLNAMMF